MHTAYRCALRRSSKCQQGQSIVRVQFGTVVLVDLDVDVLDLEQVPFQPCWRFPGAHSASPTPYPVSQLDMNEGFCVEPPSASCLRTRRLYVASSVEKAKKGNTKQKTKRVLRSATDGYSDHLPLLLPIKGTWR